MTDPSTHFSPTDTSPAGTKLRNGLVALTAIALTVLVFFGLRTQSAVPTLASLAKTAVPLEQAVGNDKPTLIEFYADWCTSCQAMAPSVAAAKQEYGDRINFVMLNVDNDKWLPEILAYRVDGIPHFEFLNRRVEAVGSTLGEQPPAIFAANLEALANGEALPYANRQGSISSLDTDPNPPVSSGQSDPRSHGAQVRS